jgi:hypothetical protein
MKNPEEIGVFSRIPIEKRELQCYNYSVLICLAPCNGAVSKIRTYKMAQ